MSIKALLEYDQRVTDLMNQLMTVRWTSWARLLAEVPDVA